MADPRIGAPKIVNASQLKILGRPIQRYVDISENARDGGTAGVAAITDASSSLQPGCLLVRATGGADDGTYVHFDSTDTTNGTGAEENLAVLLDFVDVSGGGRKAHVGYGGDAVYKRGQFRFGLATDKAAVEWDKVVLDSIA